MTKLISALLACLLSFLPYGVLRPEPVENAYMQVFQEFVEDRNNIAYVAVDLRGVWLEDTTKLEEAIQAYCDENDITLLPYDFDWLVEEGYIKVEARLYDGYPWDFWYFVDGERFRLSTVASGNKAVAIKAICECNNASGTNWECMVERSFGKWKIVEPVIKICWDA